MSGPPPVPGGRSDRDREAARRRRTERRTGGRPATPAGRTALAERPRTAREARPPRTSLTRRGRLVLAALAVLVAVAAWFLWSLYQPFHGDGGDEVAVTIPRDAGVGQIAELLAEEGVISSTFFFELRARLGGYGGDLKSGDYTLRSEMSHVAALDALSEGPPPPETVSLVIPEGKSRREIAPSIKSLEGDYLKATLVGPKTRRVLDPADYGAEDAQDLEGFLFPATYEMKPGQHVDALVAKQLRTFKEQFRAVDLSEARRKNLTPYDVLIIASLIERETAVAEERPLIASVIYNRLSMGEALGIDATTRFQFNEWEEPITQSQLDSPSPYNTRRNPGLPPGPIGSPGIESIKAAAAPEESDYLFYVADPCDPDGLKHTFHETSAEFEAAVAKYNAAREAAGGRAPRGC